ncbi:mucoidy inhibitor MuiA family protein [Dysgonomonas capnocytophagoides]|uniref:Mucoidy inhibitor MuiA family protein n=1 Tax=Dysgonomonas capnocytophagoides TaxID=45254 RepID=A0A4Y8L3W8_9BACT|nr:DUF4139 domain-containing protein [Dysgonomonas capnocytophagoides]TFD96768.1 mucoidy inhibitor MuiA family protein [Dysgonomonas capnocytophagoides]
MKRKLFASMCLSLCIFIGVYANEKKVFDSELKSATVFFKGAELNHKTSGSLVRGENEIYINGLSPNIDLNSLKMKASNGIVISAYEFSVNYLKDIKSVNRTVKVLLDSIDIYQRKNELLSTDINVTSNLIALLQKGTDKNVAGSENGLGIDELIKTMEYYKTKSTELLLVQAEYNKKKKKNDEALTRLRNQLAQETTNSNKNSGVLKVTLSAPVASICDFDISYYTPLAGWLPYYDVNVLSVDKPISLKFKSKVKQTTGLDWNKVKLTLSTATPSNGKVAPLFNSWFLQNMQFARASGSSRLSQNSYSYDSKEMLEEVVVVGSVAKKNVSSRPLYVVDGNIVTAEYVEELDPSMIKDRQKLSEDVAAGLYGSSAASGVEVITLKKSMDDYISVADNDMNINYEIDIPYTIPGNGKEQSIDLQSKEIKAEYKYYCAPKLDTETYLLAEISDWENLNLLTGKANVTYDGTYVGETVIDAHSTHAKLSLTLGTDKRISVKREKLKDFSSTKFLDNNKKQEFRYRIVVKNNQSRPIKMVLKDQYPISMQKNIEVELLIKESTPWTANKTEVGVVTWEEDIAAGQTKTYEIGYTVKYPKDLNLNL